MAAVTHREGPFIVMPHCPLCDGVVYRYRGQAYATREDAERARNTYIRNRLNKAEDRRIEAGIREEYPEWAKFTKSGV